MIIQIEHIDVCNLINILKTAKDRYSGAFIEVDNEKLKGFGVGKHYIDAIINGSKK